MVGTIQKDFFCTKPSENSISKGKVKVAGLAVNWFKMYWIKLERSKRNIKTRQDSNMILTKDAEFNAINS